MRCQGASKDADGSLSRVKLHPKCSSHIQMFLESLLMMILKDINS